MSRLGRTWVLVLSVTFLSAALAWWTTRAHDAPTARAPALAPLEALILEHGDERVEVRRAQGARATLLRARSGKAPETHVISAPKTRALWEALGASALPFVPLPDASAPETYGLTPATQATLTIKREGSSAQWMLGDPRFGAQGFYALDEGARVGTIALPALRWMRYAMTHLPTNQVTDLSVVDVARVATQLPDQSPIVGTQHQMDTPDYAYWQWQGREGASRVLERWVRRLLKPRIRGPLRATRPPEASEALRATLTDAQGGAMTLVWAMDSQSGWVSAPSLNGLWAPVRRADVTDLVQHQTTLAAAAKSEALYSPLAPGAEAHQGHAH